MMFEAIGWANRVKRSKNVCNAHALFSPNEFHVPLNTYAHTPLILYYN